MRVEEAAAILGVPVSVDIDDLKSTYKKLAFAWHPDKCNDPRAKAKFQQICIAYTKLISSRSGESEVDNSDEEEKVYDENVHEMKAFMRMFMDLVGIFNDEQSSEESKTGSVSFGMMLGHPPNGTEDYSSDEDEVDDDDYDSDTNEEVSWEPMSKHHSAMNLKDQIREKILLSEKEFEELEAKRKLKNAKKRAEKRRKQKEKRVREAAAKAEEDERARLAEAASLKEQEELAKKRREELRLAQEAEVTRRKELFQMVGEGRFDRVRELLEDSSSGYKATERLGSGGKSGAGLLHHCVTNYTELQESTVNSDIAAGKLNIAKYLLSLKSPSLDIGLLDDDGRAVIHVAAMLGDVNFIDLLVDHRSTYDKKSQQPIDINVRCLATGWTPLHYAANSGILKVCKSLIAAGALLNIHALPKDKDAEKGPTPLELVRQNLQLPQSLAKRESLEAVAAELQCAIEKLDTARLQRDLEKSHREAQLKAEKIRLSQKEQAERELLERKQKQLKEKQDRLREEEENKKSIASLALIDEKKKKKTKDKDQKKTLTPSTNMKNTDVVEVALAADVNQQSPPGILPEVGSRDELLDHLLAMGFPEAECMRAINVCGLNVDNAITWLCDQPKPNVNPLVDFKKIDHIDQSKLKEKDKKELSKRSSPLVKPVSTKVGNLRLDESKKKAEDETAKKRTEENTRKVSSAKKDSTPSKAQALLQQQLQQQYSQHSIFNPAADEFIPTKASKISSNHPVVSSDTSLAKKPTFVSPKVFTEPENRDLNPPPPGLEHYIANSLSTQSSSADGIYMTPLPMTLRSRGPSGNESRLPLVNQNHPPPPGLSVHEVNLPVVFSQIPPQLATTGVISPTTLGQTSLLNDNTMGGSNYNDGAVHLSAVAKPFVPKYTTSPSIIPHMNDPPPVSTLDIDSNSSWNFGLPQPLAAGNLPLGLNSTGPDPVSWVLDNDFENLMFGLNEFVDSTPMDRLNNIGGLQSKQTHRLESLNHSSYFFQNESANIYQTSIPPGLMGQSANDEIIFTPDAFSQFSANILDPFCGQGGQNANNFPSFK